MKKIISIILIIIFVSSLFAGCENTDEKQITEVTDKTVNNGVKDDKPDYVYSDKNENTMTNDNFKEEYPIFNLVDEKDVFKEPVTFECNGKIITVTPHYTDITFTDIYPDKSFKFRDNAVRLDFEDDRKTKYLTKDGEIITPEEYENNYKTDNEFYPEYVFDGEVTLPDGTLGSFIGNGVICVMTGEPGAYTQWLYNEDGEPLTPNGFDRIGYFNYDGIAAVSQDHKIGFIDEQENILLEPIIAYDEIRYSLIIKTKESGFSEYIYENAFILPIQNKLVIITIET